ncbi:MAG: FIST N-terminal domain-containing protein [Dehalococcoidia bacterium]
MKLEQTQWTESRGWEPATPREMKTADLALVFSSTARLEDAGCLEEIKCAYPHALIFGCSTAGEIHDVHVDDDSIAVTAIDFEHTELRYAGIRMFDVTNSYDAGERLAQILPHEGLVHVFVLSDGLKVNGSDLVKGLSARLPEGVSITGGLSGDGDRFAKTLVILEGKPQSDAIGAIGFYGDALRVGYASLGGWDSFGPERLITRSEGNVLYELDGKSALELYKQYLGKHAAGLPATGLLFPLSLRTRDGETPVVRTILGVDEEAQSMTFAGDVPMGAYARLMKANFDRLIDGAVGAARTSHEAVDGSSPDLAILISCVGRKMVLKQRVEEEVEGVRDVLGEHTALAGFYSYGEISPFTPHAKCELHNQTMTITTLSERAA